MCVVREDRVTERQGPGVWPGGVVSVEGLPAPPSATVAGDLGVFEGKLVVVREFLPWHDSEGQRGGDSGRPLLY